MQIIQFADKLNKMKNIKDFLLPVVVFTYLIVMLTLVWTA